MDYKALFTRIQAATKDWGAKLETSKLHQRVVMCTNEDEKRHIFWHGDGQIGGFIYLCNTYHAFNKEMIEIFNNLRNSGI